MSPLRARQVLAEDFHRFDHVFAMDRSNLANLQSLRPARSTASLQLFLKGAEVPDPYYGGNDGFDHVLDLIDTRMKVLFDRLQ